MNVLNREHQTGKETRYIEAKLTDQNKIENIRDNLFNKFIESNKYKIVEPHITIIPPFILPKRNLDLLKKTVQETDLKGAKVTINGLSVWPSLQNPRVILFDVNVHRNMSKIRNNLLNRLKQLDSNVKYKPVPTHITLFKSENGYEIKESTKDQIQNLIWENRKSGKWNTTINYIDIPLTE